MQFYDSIDDDAAVRVSRRPHIKPLAVPIKEACRIGGFGNTTAYELMKEGRLKTIKIGARRLVLYSSLEELISAGAA